MVQYHLVGKPFDIRPQIFELRLNEHLADINLETHGIIDNIPHLDPTDYFITSGDAVAKATKLEKDLWALASRISALADDARIPPHLGYEDPFQDPIEEDNIIIANDEPQLGKYQKYVKALYKAAGDSRSLLRKLKDARGEACFLETEWRNHVLLCIPKNPRKKT